MSYDLTEAALARRFAAERWGASTGFHCDHCGHDQAWQLHGKRSRVYQCKRCRHQKSVTADTAMHGTKLPLRVWEARAEWHEHETLPTSREFAQDQGIAPSSAWHLNQRFMAAIDLGTPEHDEFGGHTVVDAHLCRRPQRTPDLPEDARPYLREKREQFLATRRGTRLLNDLVLGPGGREMVLVDACASPEVADRGRAQPLVLDVALHHRGVERYVRNALERKLRTVSIRWLPVYVRCLVQLWSRLRDPRVQFVSWIPAVLAGPFRSLPALRARATA